MFKVWSLQIGPLVGVNLFDAQCTIDFYASNPLGISGNYDRITFAPYYLFKDLITIFIFIFVLSSFVFFMPNYLGDSENYIVANPMQTPAAIVPEW